MSDSRDQDVEYWFTQARTYLDILAEKGVVDQTEHDVRANHNAGHVVVTCPRLNDRESMAALITEFDRAGFTIMSTTTDENLRIDASADRLTVPYSEVEP